MKVVNTAEKEISIDELVNNKIHGSVIVYKSKSSIRMSIIPWCMLTKLGEGKYGFVRLGYPNESNPTYVSQNFRTTVELALAVREVHAFNKFEDFIKFSQNNK